MALLEASGIGKNFGETKVLKDISLTLEQGEALAIIGSSGSGKTTLLRCLNFLERPDTGVIRVNGETMWDAADPATQRESEVRKKRLHFGLVFQNFNLFPQYTALQNVMLAGELLAYYLSMKNLRRMSLPVNDPVSIQMYRDVCWKKRVRRAPELRQNAGLTTPLLAGLFHTKLYLPATGYSAEERKLVFYHELTHYCHRDLWYKMLLRICATIYWFNPFLLIMLKEADKDIENLCDTAVINRVNKKDHRLYRQLLLRTVAMNNQIPYVTASLNDSGMVFKDRILYMVNIRKLRRGILPGILVTDGCIYVSANIEGPGALVQHGKILRVVFGVREKSEFREELKELSENIRRDALEKFSYVSPIGAAGLYYHATAADFQREGEEREAFKAMIR